jgi:superfamily I DNA/RNA helicase
MNPPSEQRATGSLEEIGGRDHAITSEYRLFGPPGTGKTTNLSRQIRRAVDRYGPEAVLVTSFSRAAAAELAGRDLPVSGDRVGTLHSHCWHALGGPEIAESNVETWNRDNPHLVLTPQKKQGKLDGEESGEGDSETAKDGDALLQRLSRNRGLMLPRIAWPETLLDFEKRWTTYKKDNGLLDFTDLIETALRDCPIAPKNPSVIFADEAQDLNRMQLALVRRWGEHASYFIVAGDDDQTIYQFTGATPEAFLDPDIPDDHKIILKQSYRVPGAVHQFAEGLIRQVSRRQAKEYLPRPEDGALDRMSHHEHYRRADYAILDTATEHLARGQTVMFLAACSYMVAPIVMVLRRHGIPFHNPYRTTNGFWNPLRLGKATSTPSRILALLIGHPDYGEAHRPWSHADLAAWAEPIRAKGVLRHGMKAKIKAGDVAGVVTMAHLAALFEPDALVGMMAAWDAGHPALLGWWLSKLTADAQKRAAFPSEIVATRGPRALLETPKVIVGTIHSVKGGEADVVYLFPDLSAAGDAQYARPGPPRDSVIRQFYVGATRARVKLYLCQSADAGRISL